MIPGIIIHTNKMENIIRLSLLFTLAIEKPAIEDKKTNRDTPPMVMMKLLTIALPKLDFFHASTRFDKWKSGNNVIEESPPSGCLSASRIKR
jgi:hypothetical protein